MLKTSNLYSFIFKFYFYFIISYVGLSMFSCINIFYQYFKLLHLGKPLYCTLKLEYFQLFNMDRIYVQNYFFLQSYEYFAHSLAFGKKSEVNMTSAHLTVNVFGVFVVLFSQEILIICLFLEFIRLILCLGV